MVSLSGFRVRERELAELGVTLPGLRARAGAIGALPPLGLLTLAGMTPESWSVSLHEAAAVDEGLVERIVGEGPCVVAISALTASIEEGYRLADQLRERGVTVVMGGLHVTACPDEALGHADAVAVGDGEPAWPMVLRDAEKGELRGVYRGVKPFDLRESTLPRFDLLGGRRRARYTVQSSRGCPLACEFCAASRLLGPFRRKPAERLRAELAAIKKLEARPMVELADDNTFAAGDGHGEMLSVMEESGARWFTEADWRLGENEHVLERLAASGCVQVLVGFESLVHGYGGMGAKRASMGRMMEAAERIQEAGVCVIGCYIAGCDGETGETIDELGGVLERSPCADVQVTLQTPFAGTELRRRLEREGRLRADRGWSHCTLFDVAYEPIGMGAGELQERFNGLLKRVFGAEMSARREKIRREVWRKHPDLSGRARA